MVISIILFYPITLEVRRGITDELERIPLHLVLFSAALVELTKSIPVRSLILSSHLFFSLPLFFFIMVCLGQSSAWRRPSLSRLFMLTTAEIHNYCMARLGHEQRVR